MGRIDSSGITRSQEVTIVGCTTPGEFVFSDSAAGFYQFNGPLLPTDAQGFSSPRMSTVSRSPPEGQRSDGLIQNEFLIVDAQGHHLIRNFPILYVGNGS